VLSDLKRQVITAIVDEDQLSLAIGRNGQNVRLASQLIGWQIDLYGSREWLERGADMSLFAAPADETYELADFPLSELDLEPGTLAALNGAGYSSFLDIIDMERTDLLAVPDLGEAGADRVLEIIDELTVVEGEDPAAAESGPDAGAESDADEVDVDEAGAEAAAESSDDEPVEEPGAEVGAEASEVGEDDLQN
jgi:N utilization substance protein A